MPNLAQRVEAYAAHWVAAWLALFHLRTGAPAAPPSQAQVVQQQVTAAVDPQLDSIGALGDAGAEALRVGGGALAGGLAGLALGPIGAVVGAAIGAVIAALPFGSWELYDKWRHDLDAMSVEQRNATLRAFRLLSQHASELDHDPAEGPWALIHDDFMGTRSGVRNVVYILFQAVLERDSFPPSIDPRTIAHAVACYAVDKAKEQGKPLRDSRDFQHLVQDLSGPEGNRTGSWTGHGSQWLVPHLVANADRSCNDIIADAIAAGVADIGAL